MTSERGSRHAYLTVTWIAKPGFEREVKAILEQLADATRREPGCIDYKVFQEAEDHSRFVLYEEYRDADALRQHGESSHFRRLVLGSAAGLLERRQRVGLRAITAAAPVQPQLHHVSSPFPAGSRDRVRTFYEGVGLSEISVPSSLSSRDLLWFSAGPDLELHFFPDLPDATSNHHFCLAITDLDTLRLKLELEGHSPFDDVAIPARPRFFCRDPVGNLVEFTKLEG